MFAHKQVSKILYWVCEDEFDSFFRYDQRINLFFKMDETENINIIWNICHNADMVAISSSRINNIYQHIWYIYLD